MNKMGSEKIYDEDEIKVRNRVGLDFGEVRGDDGRAREVVFENLGLLTITDLSWLIQVPKKTIRDWVYKRQIPYKKVGRHIRFLSSEIAHWINR